VELRIEIARTVDQIEELRTVWDVLPWEREEAELDNFLARLRARSNAIGPYAIVVYRGDEPVSGLIGRIESRELKTNLGYRVVYAPSLRVLQIVDGGLVAADVAAIPPLVAALGDALARGDAQAAALPPLPVESELFRPLRRARRAARAATVFVPDLDPAAARVAGELRRLPCFPQLGDAAWKSRRRQTGCVRSSATRCASRSCESRRAWIGSSTISTRSRA